MSAFRQPEPSCTPKPLTRRVHDAAYDESRNGTAGQMESRAFFHPQVSGQSSLCEEVCWQLDGAAKAGSNHGGSHTPVESLDPFTTIDLSQAVIRVSVLVLSSDGKERRVGLESGLHQKERRSCCSAYDARRCSGEDIDAERLDFRVVVDSSGERGAQGFVETKTAAV